MNVKVKEFYVIIMGHFQSLYGHLQLLNNLFPVLCILFPLIFHFQLFFLSVSSDVALVFCVRLILKALAFWKVLR